MFLGFLPYAEKLYTREKLFGYAEAKTRPETTETSNDDYTWLEFQLAIDRIFQLCFDTCASKLPR